MIKKPTLFVLLGAIVLGAAVYYFDWRRSLKEKPPEDSSKPAFSIPSSGIASFTLTRPAKAGEPAIHFEKRDGVWRIVQPIDTEADQPSVQGIVDGITSARTSQTEPGTPDRLMAYGLNPPEVSLEFQLQDGTKHTLQLGSKDFTGISVYSVVDGAKSVALLPESLLVSADKPVEDLRDHAVLHISSSEVASFSLKNASGELAVAKDKAGWKFTKPSGMLADDNGVGSLLTAAATAKMAAVASEKPENLSKYGLASPAIIFTAVDEKGRTATLLVGRKEGKDYFARDTSRPMIFRINEDLYKKLAERYEDLRDKKLVHFEPADVNHAEIRNANGTTVLNRKKEEEWTIEAPEGQKGKSAGIWKLFSPLTQGRAEEIFEHPAPDLVAKVAKPAIEVVLTDKNGKKLTVQISKASGEFVYARTSEGATIFKLKKQILEDLNFKAADLVF